MHFAAAGVVFNSCTSSNVYNCVTPPLEYPNADFWNVTAGVVPVIRVKMSMKGDVCSNAFDRSISMIGMTPRKYATSISPVAMST